MSIEDVTDRVNAAVQAWYGRCGRAEKPRRAVMNTIEKESFDKTGLRSDVVTLYQGGLYHLYRYKKYTDVRLVFAPEKDIAFFGGDPDNFEYPRYDLDICFFRVYEDGKPVKPPHLSEVEPGRHEGRASWCSWPGNPGRTDRLNTVRAPGVPPRPRFSATAQSASAVARCMLRNFSERSAGKRPPRRRRAVWLSELPQGAAGRAGRPARPGHHGRQA